VKKNLRLTLTLEETRALMYAAGTCLLARDELGAQRVGVERKTLRSAQRKLYQAQHDLAPQPEARD
jgi:hypothetical protein